MSNREYQKPIKNYVIKIHFNVTKENFYIFKSKLTTQFNVK